MNQELKKILALSLLGIGFGLAGLWFAAQAKNPSFGKVLWWLNAIAVGLNLGRFTYFLFSSNGKERRR